MSPDFHIGKDSCARRHARLRSATPDADLVHPGSALAGSAGRATPKRALIVSAILGALVGVFGCATLEPADVDARIDEYAGRRVQLEGQTRRGVPVSATGDAYLYLFTDNAATVTVLSTEQPEPGQEREVSARVVAYEGQTKAYAAPGVADAVETFLREQAGVDDDEMQKALERAFEVLAGFAAEYGGRFFLVEQ